VYELEFKRRLKRLENLVGEGGGSSPLSTKSVVVVPFTFATASPLVLAPVGTSSPVVRAGIRIDVGFDGVGASLEIGTTASPGIVLGTGDNLPAFPGQYEVDFVDSFAGPDTLQLTIVPGAGATRGSGVVYYELGGPP
jgi:hypothetical protein